MMNSHPGRTMYFHLMFVCGIFLLTLNTARAEFPHPTNETSKPLRILTVLGAPFVMKDRQTGKFTGLLIDILDHAGISIDHVDTAVRGEYGWEESPGAFGGAIGDLVAGKYDLAVGPFSIRSQRAKVVSFTLPVFHNTYMVLYKLPKDTEWKVVDDRMATLLKPFSTGLWFIIILMALISSIVLYIIRRYSPYEHDVITTTSEQRDDNSFSKTSWGSDLMYLLGSLTGRNAIDVPKSLSGRVLTAFWWLFSLMTVGAYVAGLAAILFRFNPHTQTLPFGSIEEMIASPEVKILEVKNSTSYRYIADHDGGVERALHKYWLDNWDDVMVNSVMEALKMMEDGDGQYGVFMNEATANFLAGNVRPCDKVVIEGQIGDDPIGFACQKGSSVCEELNVAILNLHETGEMTSLEKKWFWNECREEAELIFQGETFFDTFDGKEPFHLSPYSLNIHRFSAAFLVLIVGGVLALVLLVAEILYSRRQGNIHRRLKTVVRGEDGQGIRDHEFTPGHDD